MSYSIPTEMRALQISERFDDIQDAIRNLKVVTVPIPRLNHGQLLVKIEAAPCNPSDLLSILGKYVIQKNFPIIPGREGSGTVVATGGGFLGRMLLGKRVACVGATAVNGTWAEYFVVDSKFCIPLNSQLTFEQGASLIINPLSALGMLEKAKKEKHAAIVQTAAASQLGRMLTSLAINEKIPVIHVVRREEQEDLLLSLGAKYVLNSEKPLFEDRLKEYAHDLKATIAFDAVAGNMTGIVANALPQDSTVVVYGSLSMMERCDGIRVWSLIAENKKIEGFLLSNWIKEKSVLGMYKATSHLQSLIGKEVLKTTVRKSVPLQDVSTALLEYQKEMTLGKIIISPQK